MLSIEGFPLVWTICGLRMLPSRMIRKLTMAGVDCERESSPFVFQFCAMRWRIRSAYQPRPSVPNGLLGPTPTCPDPLCAAYMGLETAWRTRLEI